MRMCDGRRFQADGAATKKELLESWRLNRGTIKYNKHFGQLQPSLVLTDDMKKNCQEQM